jgi:hypothetical protein
MLLLIIIYQSETGLGMTDPLRPWSFFCILPMYHGASLRGHYRHGFGAAGSR